MRITKDNPTTQDVVNDENGQIKKDIKTNVKEILMNGALLTLAIMAVTYAAAYAVGFIAFCWWLAAIAAFGFSIVLATKTSTALVEFVGDTFALTSNSITSLIRGRKERHAMTSATQAVPANVLVAA